MSKQDIRSSHEDQPHGGNEGALDIFGGAVGLVDWAIDALISAVSGIRRRQADGPGCRGRGERPLQVIRAMSMVNDHVLRDVGLDRAAIAAIVELSADDIDGCRLDRSAA